MPRKLASVLGVPVIAGASLVLVACGNDDGADVDVGRAEVREVTVASSDTLAFEPSEIRVRAGEQVRLTLDNSDSSGLHDFTVEHIAVEAVEEEGAEHGDHGDNGDFALHVAADAGESALLEFTPTEPGEYEFVCSVPGHEEGGMTGVLFVEETP